jgi:hypothetical protein
MNTSADVSKFKISPLPWLNVEFCLRRCRGGGRALNGNLHFPVPSMNRLNQIEPATFLILTFFWRSLGIPFSLFLYWSIYFFSKREPFDSNENDINTLTLKLNFEDHLPPQPLPLSTDESVGVYNLSLVCKIWYIYDTMIRIEM